MNLKEAVKSFYETSFCNKYVGGVIVGSRVFITKEPYDGERFGVCIAFKECTDSNGHSSQSYRVASLDEASKFYWTISLDDGEEITLTEENFVQIPLPIVEDELRKFIRVFFEKEEEDMNKDKEQASIGAQMVRNMINRQMEVANIVYGESQDSDFSHEEGEFQEDAITSKIDFVPEGKSSKEDVNWTKNVSKAVLLSQKVKAAIKEAFGEAEKSLFTRQLTPGSAVILLSEDALLGMVVMVYRYSSLEDEYYLFIDGGYYKYPREDIIPFTPEYDAFISYFLSKEREQESNKGNFFGWLKTTFMDDLFSDYYSLSRIDDLVLITNPGGYEGQVGRMLGEEQHEHRFLISVNGDKLKLPAEEFLFIPKYMTVETMSDLYREFIRQRDTND